jgi:gas vesicle protein
MKIRIIETGAIKPLHATMRNGLDWTEDLLGNSDALHRNPKTGEVEMETEEEYAWWKEYIENLENDDKEVLELAEELDMDVSEIDGQIADSLTNDYSDHHDTIQRVLKEIREEN